VLHPRAQGSLLFCRNRKARRRIDPRFQPLSQRRNAYHLQGDRLHPFCQNDLFQHLCGCYLFNASGLPPRGFFYFRCCCNNCTINQKSAQEIVLFTKQFTKLMGGFQKFFTLVRRRNREDAQEKKQYFVNRGYRHCRRQMI